MGRCKKEPKKKHSQQQLISALESVKKGSSQFAAAKKFSIPRSTLFNKINGRTEMGKKPGPRTVLLLEEESIIEKWMFGLAVRGFPVTKRQLLQSIQLYLNINKRKTIFTNNLPGRKWYNAFRKRHPKISEKISQNLTMSRAAVSVDKLRNWHSEILKYCEEHNLVDVLNDPSRVFNMDEKGFILTPSKEVVLVKRGDKAVYNRSRNDEKECVTALLGGSAAGKMTPPMIIHSFKRMPSAILLNNPEKWSVGISDSGWQTQQTFHDYMTNIFYKWLLEEKIQLPVIVFIDGHKSHVSLTLSDFCAAHQIELIALYPNSTHLTQPMDVGVFKSLNSKWTNSAKDWRVENKYAKIERKDVATILKKSIDAVNYAELLKNAFKACGLFPFNVENIDFSRVLPSMTTSATPQEELWTPIETMPTNIVGVSTQNDKNTTVDRLQHFESLLGDSVLNLFRSSADVWNGDKEYSIVFTIWKRMYKEASESMSSEFSEPIIVNIDSTEGNSTDTSQGVADFSIIDNGDSVWLMEAIDTTIIDETSNSCKVSLAETEIMTHCTPFNTLAAETDNVIEDRCNERHHSDCDSCVESNSQHSVKENVHGEIASTGTNDLIPAAFSPDAFKDAFFWPVEDKKKIKKKITPKISSVMSSEDWREHMRLKNDEKLQQQAEKEARKAARERKILESAKMAAEKLKLKEQKVIAAKILAENKSLKRLEQKQTKTRKRSDLATKSNKN